MKTHFWKRITSIAIKVDILLAIQVFDHTYYIMKFVCSKPNPSCQKPKRLANNVLLLLFILVFVLFCCVGGVWVCGCAVLPRTRKEELFIQTINLHNILRNNNTDVPVGKILSTQYFHIDSRLHLVLNK